MALCLTCRGKGMLGGCPSCNQTIEVNVPTISLEPEVLDDCAIPSYYRNMTWSKQILLDTHQDVQSKGLLERYAEQLTRIYDIFSRGDIPNKSFFVIAPKNMGKQTWAYCCMQEALKHSHTVVPIIDNTQYKRLNIISSDRISSKFLKEQSYTIEDYNTADVMFMTVDPDNFQASYRTLESVLSKRSRAGKATFVISRYTLEQMSLPDYTNTFSKNIQATQLQDRNKYVVIIGG